MWNREESQQPRHQKDGVASSAAVPVSQPVSAPHSATVPHTRAAAASTGVSLVFKGDLSGAEDLTVDGTVDGKISLPGYTLTVGAQAKITAEIAARTVVIYGTVNGNVTAAERFEIKAGGRMNGDVVSPKVIMAEDSEFRGRVDMSNAAGSRQRERSEPARQESTPVHAVAAASAH